MFPDRSLIVLSLAAALLANPRRHATIETVCNDQDGREENETLKAVNTSRTSIEGAHNLSWQNGLVIIII